MRVSRPMIFAGVFVFGMLCESCFGISRIIAADFRDSVHVHDQKTGESVFSSTVTNNDSDRAIDVFVTSPDGSSRKVGRLLPGESARVTAIPRLGTGGTYLFDRK